MCAVCERFRLIRGGTGGGHGWHGEAAARQRERLSVQLVQHGETVLLGGAVVLQQRRQQLEHDRYRGQRLELQLRTDQMLVHSCQSIGCQQSSQTCQ